MKITKVKDVTTPSRGNLRDAGIDFYIPNDYIGTTEIPSGHSVLIPSGIHASIPKGYMLTAFNKSGIASKNNLLVGACVCDEEYQGEIHINLHNVGISGQTIQPGQKIAQFILVPVFYDTIEEVSTKEELYNNIITTRGEGGFGSTNNK